MASETLVEALPVFKIISSLKPDAIISICIVFTPILLLVCSECIYKKFWKGDWDWNFYQCSCEYLFSVGALVFKLNFN